MSTLSRRGDSFPSRAYLVAYNGGMLVGWTFLLGRMAVQTVTSQSAGNMYPIVRELLLVCQTGAIVEIAHAMLKLVRSPVGTTALQVLARNMVLYGAMEIGGEAAASSPFLTQMVAAWSISDIIRYSFYLYGLLRDKEHSPKLLQWLRYSTFIVLYPIGIIGEMMCFVNALPAIREHHTWSVVLPNPQNFVFRYDYFVCAALSILYPMGSYVMYSYMLGQRRKVLGAAVTMEKATTTRKDL